MPDLGLYANTVLMAYAITVVLLAGLIILTWVQSRRAKRILSEYENRHEK